MNDRVSAKLAATIMQTLYPYRRQLDIDNPCQHTTLMDCFDIHYHKLITYIKNNLTIEFVLPAFPAKSPNSSKTIGPLPDLGERLSLSFLDNLCKKITDYYLPGAKIIICSDGRVFNDLVKVSNDNVSAYAHEIENIIRENSLTSITTFGLDQCYSTSSYDAMREQLVKEYGESISVIKNKVQSNNVEKIFFNGIHRFIYEDELALEKSISKNQIRKLSKITAYQVIQRSNAWSRLLEKQFPHAIRLSIHPQPCGSPKLGIMLLKSKDVWATPWHRIVLYNGAEHVLIRKKEAEKLCARPVFINNQFSHYHI